MAQRPLSTYMVTPKGVRLVCFTCWPSSWLNFVLFCFVLCVEIPEPAPTRHSLLPERRHSLPPYSPPSKELKLPERSADIQTVLSPTSESVLDTTKTDVVASDVAVGYAKRWKGFWDRDR